MRPALRSALPRLLFVGVAVVALVQPVRAAMAESWRRVASGTGAGDDASPRFHLDAWHVAVRIAADHPVLGTGQETFPDVFPRYSHAVLPPDRAAALDAYRVESPHNVYLAIAAGAGLPALLAYLGVLAAVVAAVARAARRTSERWLRCALVAILAAVAGHLVTDAFMTAEVTGTWLFWVLMGAGLGVVAGAEFPDATADAAPGERIRDPVAAE